MATMGRREITKKKHSDSLGLGIATPAVNLSVVPTMICPVTTLGIQPPVVGGPIMREDFITTTGPMPPKID
jgi:hypothetical protein